MFTYIVYLIFRQRSSIEFKSIILQCFSITNETRQARKVKEEGSSLAVAKQFVRIDDRTERIARERSEFSLSFPSFNYTQEREREQKEREHNQRLFLSSSTDINKRTMTLNRSFYRKYNRDRSLVWTFLFPLSHCLVDISHHLQRVRSLYNDDQISINMFTIT